MSKRQKKKGRKGKSTRVSLRDQMRAAKSGQNIADSEKTSDPIGSLDSEWWKTAKEADKWKPKWECMQALMGFCCGDSFGNGDMPQKVDDNSKAGDVIALFAKWLHEEKHIFLRQHILKLLIPFSRSFGKTHWKKANKLAEALILEQFSEKKHGFLPLVTPALIAVYIASGSQLKRWKDYLIQSMESPQAQVRMSCWDFLAKICVLSKQSGSKLKTRGPKDVQLFINDKNIIHHLTDTIINDKDKDVRAACAKFIYGSKQICNKISILENAYQEILNDKRASMALDIASDLFNNDKTVLSGGKADHEAITKKVEQKQARQKKKQASSRKNNMRAMIAKAKKDSAKTGGGGAIQIAAVGGATNTQSNDKEKKSRQGIKALMNKYKKKDDDDRSDDDEDRTDTEDTQSESDDQTTKHKQKSKNKKIKNKNKTKNKAKNKKRSKHTYEEDEEDDEERNGNAVNRSSDSDSEDSDDSETKREREREKKKKERERIRKEREKERERKRKEKEKERARKKKEEERERERDRERKRKRKYSDDEEDDEEDSDSIDSDSPQPKRDKRRGKVKQSKTKTIHESRNSAKGKDGDGSSLVEIKQLSWKVDNISQNVESLQDGMNGMERKIGDLAKNSQSKSGMSTKAEEKIMKILGQLQKDVKIMKNDISYIKACWEDAESVED
eukprot:191324_1